MREWTMALVLMLAAGACGGSDDSADDNVATTAATATNSTETTQGTVQEPTDDTQASAATTTIAVNALGDGDESTTFYGNQPGTATVEVGDIRYEFDLSLLCLSMAGAMGVAGTAVDGSDVTVDASFPPEGWETSGEEWEPPSISIDDDGRDISWTAGGVAGEVYPEGMSEITSFTSDGRLAVGEASFVNTYTSFDDPTVATGRFEFVCPAS